MRKLFLSGVLLIMLSGAGAKTPDSSMQTGQRETFAIRGMKGLFWDGIENYLKAVPWMAEHDMNWLMLCYSAYPESGRDWRKDYTPEHLAEMKDLVTKAADKGITVSLSFNPGIWSNPPLCHSCEEDYQAAWRKVKAAHGIGITWIALCLDDISKSLVPADKDKYGTLQAAQVAFTNRMWSDMQRLDPQMHLIFCPSAYTTGEMKKHPDYTEFIGKNLAPEIDIFWTGPAVCSPTITVADANEAAGLLGRKAFVWDNYPVNDMFPWRPLLAPVKGRDKHLAGAVSGILFNPMKQWELNRIPMVSVADYLNDPVNYDAADEPAKVMAEFAEQDRPAVELLLKYYGSSFWGDKNFPPGVKIGSEEQAKAVHSELEKLKALMTGPESGLHEMWDALKDTVEADLLNARMLSEGAVTFGNAMQGGAPELALKGFGEPAGLVYARPTGKSRISVMLKVDEISSGPTRLRLMARNGDKQKPRVRIMLNDEKLVEGLTDFSQASFESREFEIPAGTVTDGKAELTVENLESTGTLGMPPWFAVKWAQLLP